jgi:hypothetical protein
MQTVLANQQNSLNQLLELSKQDRLLQLIQTKENQTINKDNDDKQLEELKKLNASIKDLNESSNDKNKGGVNSNVIKLFTEIKKTTEQIKELAQAAIPAGPLSKEQARDITGKAMERRQFRGIGDRVGEFKEKAKDFFTMRGFLDKTGIVERGTGGVFSDMLDKREERQKYVASRLKMDPTARLHGTEKASKIFSRQFDEQQNVQRNIRKNESTLSTFKKQGFTEEQIKRSEEFKKRDSLATDLAKVDTRVRPQGFDPKTGLVKQPVISDIKPEVITEKAKPKSAKKQKATASAAVSSVISAIKPETITEKPQTQEDQKRSAVILPFTQPKKVDKNAESAASALSGEETGLEQNRKMDEQSSVLKQIEENTRGSAGAIKPAPKEEAGAGGGILDSIMGFLGTGLMTAVKFLFSPKNLLKAFTKFFAPAIIIGSLVNGIMDGFKVFSETGSIGEALIAGLGGVLSFLTFGLFDAETIKSVVNAVSGFVTDYIVEPITKFFNFLGDSFNTYIKEPVMAAFDTVAGLFDEFIVQPLKTVFEPVTKFFSNLKDTIFGWFEGFEIPGINFSVMGKQFGFGPWHPFKSESSAKPAPAEGSKGDTASLGQDIKENPMLALRAGRPDLMPATATPSAIPAGNSNAGAGQGSAEFAATDPRRVDIAKPAEGSTASLAGSIKENPMLALRAGRPDLMPAQVAPASAPQSGNAVAKGSEQNKEANLDASKPNTGGGNTIVSAPTVNNVQNTQQTIKLQPRNRDNSVSTYLSSRYAF